MIRQVKFNNFYSFNSEQKISFLANKKQTHDYFKSGYTGQITKIASFIGSNASGKTNVMRFFSFLIYFVCRNTNNASSPIANMVYKTFFNNNKPSTFSVEFENKNSIYYYAFSIHNNIILTESLHIRNIKPKSTKIKVFSRKKNTISFLNNNYFNNISINILPKIREDVSFIAFIKKSTYSVDIVNSVYDYFFRFQTNVTEVGEINNPFHQFRILNNYLENPTFKKEVEDFLCQFDLGLDGFEIKKEETKEKSIAISVQGVHATEEKRNKLDFQYESRGTQSLFFVLSNILNALKNNNIVIIDEIEAGLHPEALNKLISYFIDEDKNKKAQLIFSSHSLGFVNKIDMHQIFLVEKNSNGESNVKRLNEVGNIRSDENFLAKYMTGVYGAFPKIRV